MKRMTPTKLIDWAKKLFGAVQPGSKEGDVEIGGNLEVDGGFKTNSINLDNTIGIYYESEKMSNIEYDQYSNATVIYYGDPYSKLSGLRIGSSLNYEVSLGYLETSTFEPVTGIYIDRNKVSLMCASRKVLTIDSTDSITLGETSLSEEQLKKLIALIPAE